jgi:hypothetical protein
VQHAAKLVDAFADAEETKMRSLFRLNSRHGERRPPERFARRRKLEAP